MYVDESGDTGLINSPTKFFVLSGIVVHESRWRDFINVLIAFRRTLKSVYGLPIRTEIHASHYINHKPVDLPRHVRLAILRNTIDELAKLNYIKITNIVVSKAAKPANYDVFNSAWGTLFQRFENTLIGGNFPGAHTNDSGLVLTDAGAGKNLVRLVRKMAVYNYIPHDPRFGGGARNVPITRVIEDLHGKDSAEALPIQMADVAAYFLHQRFAPSAYIRKQKAHHYFDRLEPVLNLRASRFHNLGVVVI
ncbi:MAG: DUF3800 domain-containing protein [Rhizobiales bacterium]|nr:DUF3800 domain-containing protein [Hyphomicrobiales bacterium]